MLDEVMTHLGIFLAVVILSLIVYSVLRLRSENHRTHFSADGAWHSARDRVCALCIGVQITWNGAEALLKTVLRP